MPSVTIEQTDINGYHIEIELNNRYGSNVYDVRVCQIYSNGMCGYPIREIYNKDRKKAGATYRRYIREFSK